MRSSLKTVSWIPTIFQHFLGTTRVNSFIIYKAHQQKGERYTQLEFVQQLVVELCESWVKQQSDEIEAGERAPKYRTLKDWQGDYATRRRGTHFCVERREYYGKINEISNKQVFRTMKRRCIVCNKNTSNCCRTCGDVYLCNFTDDKYKSCVEWFHTEREITGFRPRYDGVVNPAHLSKDFP